MGTAAAVSSFGGSSALGPAAAAAGAAAGPKVVPAAAENMIGFYAAGEGKCSGGPTRRQQKRLKRREWRDVSFYFDYTSVEVRFLIGKNLTRGTTIYIVYNDTREEVKRAMRKNERSLQEAAMHTVQQPAVEEERIEQTTKKCTVRPSPL
eukprot:gene7235-5085_t